MDLPKKTKQEIPIRENNEHIGQSFLHSHQISFSIPPSNIIIYCEIFVFYLINKLGLQ